MGRETTEVNSAQMIELHTRSRPFTVSQEPRHPMRQYGTTLVVDHPVLVRVVVLLIHSTEPDETAVVISCYLLDEAIE
jgi:hypothetical protein